MYSYNDIAKYFSTKILFYHIIKHIKLLSLKITQPSSFFLRSI